MIDLKNVSKLYHTGADLFQAVTSETLHIEKGDFVAITGHSGSGKTTLTHLMGGLTRPDSGAVTLDGTELWSLPDDDISTLRNRKISFIYQFSSLIPTLKAVHIPSSHRPITDRRTSACCVFRQSFAQG